MKFPLLLILAVLCACSGIASAQIQGEGRLTFDALPPSWIGEAPVPVDTLPLNLYPKLDPKMPALPAFDATQTAGVKLSVVPTYKGPMLQVQATDRSMAEILRAVAEAWSMKVVIAPTLQQQHLSSAVFRAPTPQDLLDIICYFSVKQLRWNDGTIFFVDKVNPDFSLALSENRANQQLSQLIEQHELEARRGGPFSFGQVKPVEPQPGWQTREFNGRKFYYIPGPKSPEAQEQTP